mgnify:FL=1
MLATGQGTSRDEKSAYYQLLVTEAKGSLKAARARQALEHQMTRQEIRETRLRLISAKQLEIIPL